MGSDVILLGFIIVGACMLVYPVLARYRVRVGGVPYLRLQRWTVMAEGLHYEPDRRTPIEVPHSADGRPGYRLLVPSDPYWIGTMNEDASRDDFCVLVGRDATLRAVVLRPEAASLTPEESALYTIRAFISRRLPSQVAEAIESVTIADEPGVRYSTRLEPDQLLTEWKFKRDGWMFVVGVKRPVDDVGSLRRAEQCLATWTWTEAPSGMTPGMVWTHDRDGLPLSGTTQADASRETDPT